jgi:DNA-binding LytR/AlgR family response regulator
MYLRTKKELTKSLHDRIRYCNEQYNESANLLNNAVQARQGTPAITEYYRRVLYNQTEIDRLEAQLHIVEMTTEG